MASRRKTTKKGDPPTPQKSAQKLSGGDYSLQVESSELDVSTSILLAAAAEGNDSLLTKGFFDTLRAKQQDRSDQTPLIDVPDEKEKYTPLIWAAKNKKPNTCRQLVEWGRANIDKQAGWNNNSALMKAAEKGHEDVVKTLLDLGADPYLKNNFGNSAVMLAAEFGKDKVIDVLIKNGMLAAKLNEKNEAKYTALILAAEEGHTSCVNLLCLAGVDIDAKNKFGKSALIMAAEFGRKDVVEVLCRKKANVNAVSDKQKSALMLASLKGHWEVVNSLIENKADIHLQVGPPEGPNENALTLACEENYLETGEEGVNGKIKIVTTLLQKGAICPKGCNELNILMKACETSCDIVKVLLQWWVQTENKRAEAKENLVLLTTPSRKDGTTCLMCAGAKGNIKVMVYLINQLQKEYDNYHQSLENRSIRGLETDEHLEELLNRYPTRPEFVKACYEREVNSKGKTAVHLLVQYYQEYPDKFKEFITEAASSRRLMYLFHLMPLIVPKLYNPSSIIQMFHDDLFPQLQQQRGHYADVKLLSALVNIAAALKNAADSHPLQAHQLNELLVKVENAIEVSMSCCSMDKRSNVAKILQDDDSARTGTEFGHAAIVCEASAFVNGPLALCIKHNLPELLGTTPIATHVDRVFQTSLRSTQQKIIHEWKDIFQVRSGCAILRYRPLCMFVIEGLAKLVYLTLVASVCHFNYCPVQLSWFEWGIIVMLGTGILFVFGEMYDRSYFLDHFTDIWNVLDCFGHVFVLIWCLCRFDLSSYHDVARASLALSTIPMSLGLLRFISAFREIGYLVNVIFAICFDLYSFLVVIFFSIMGFGITFHSLFRDNPEFSGLGSTVLTLFLAALGDHDFLKKGFQKHEFESVGLFTLTVGLLTMISYVTFLGIIVLNLIIATMNNTFDSVLKKARQQWAMMMAKNVQDCLLIREKNNPFCMLPPPLNGLIIPVVLLLTPFWNFFEWWKSQEAKDDRPSIFGSASDFILGFVSSLLCALVEIYLLYRKFYLSNIVHKYVCWLPIVIFSIICNFVLYACFSFCFPEFWLFIQFVYRFNFLGYQEYCFLLSSIILNFALCLIFWLLILIDVGIHLFFKRVRISNRDNNIIYCEKKSYSGIGEKPTGGVLEMKVIKFNLNRGTDVFGRNASVYVQASYETTYDKKVYVSHNKTCDEVAEVYLNHTFEIKLIDGGILKLQIFDRHRAVDTIQSLGDGVLFAESDEIKLQEWISNGRFEGEIFLFRPGHARTKDSKTPSVQLAVKIKYPNPPTKSHPFQQLHDEPFDEHAEGVTLYTEEDRKRIFKCLLREEQ